MSAKAFMVAVRGLLILALAAPALLAALSAPAVAAGPPGTSWMVPVAANVLAGGQSLGPGQVLAAGPATLTMRPDGVVTLVVAPGIVLWTSPVTGYPGARLTMGTDGNLVIADASGVTRWASGSTGAGAYAIMQADGNLVVYFQGRATWSSRTYKQAYAIGRFGLYGWTAAQWPCLYLLWTRESGWNERAGRPSAAYGIPQAYPGTKMAAAGPDYLTNARTQIRWGEDYIAGRYGTPCAAWAFWQASGWY